MLLTLILALSSPSMAQSRSETASASGHTAQHYQASPQASSTHASETERLMLEASQGTLRLVNQERTQRGLKPLTLDLACSKAAQDHALDSGRNRIHGHIGSDGSQPQDRYKRYSNDFSMISENWAKISDPSGKTLTPRTLVNSWMASENHRANILDATATRMGMGFYRNRSDLYGVQCFSAPANH